MARLDIESIKDAVYELEGLLELADLREDKVSALLPLMKNKLKIINTLFSEDAVLPGEENELSYEETVFPNEEDSIPEEEDVISDAEDSIPEEDREYPAEEKVMEEEILTVEEPQAAVVEEEEVSTGITMTETIASAVKPAFCINDRFRFRRELFNNSDREFENAMNVVTTMDSYDEAEEYFIGELGWDYENPEVSDFMAIIRGYFEK